MVVLLTFLRAYKWIEIPSPKEYKSVYDLIPWSCVFSSSEVIHRVLTHWKDLGLKPGESNPGD